VHLARAILAEFAGNMAKLAQERPAPIPEEAEPANSSAIADAPSSGAARTTGPPVATDPLHGGALLWRALLGWLKQLFSFRGKTG
jgi:hypothetical protein